MIDDLMVQAEHEAAALGHGYVGAVHRLLAMSTAHPEPLQRMGVDPILLREGVLASIGRGHDALPIGQLPLTTRSRNALQRAREAAAAHRIPNLRAEDVLVGIGVDESIAG